MLRVLLHAHKVCAALLLEHTNLILLIIFCDLV